MCYGNGSLRLILCFWLCVGKTERYFRNICKTLLKFKYICFCCPKERSDSFRCCCYCSAKCFGKSSFLHAIGDNLDITARIYDYFFVCIIHERDKRSSRKRVATCARYYSDRKWRWSCFLVCALPEKYYEKNNVDDDEGFSRRVHGEYYEIFFFCAILLSLQEDGESVRYPGVRDSSF